ncbi:MAG TPA: SDR family oxidoreductase [Pyrinomonadaceae bacterium]|jgi:glucose 1-dehydrogenase
MSANSANENSAQPVAPRLKGRRALVTGANSGIGRDIALRLAREGAAVVINYLSKPEAAQEVVQEIEAVGGRALAAQADVSNEQQVDEMFAQARAAFGGLDILVNNAGLETHHPILEMPADAWRKVLDVDLTGAFLCAQRAARMMVEAQTGGAIVNISSVHNIIPWGGYAHYCAAKAGLDMLTKTMALELATERVRVNSIAPGAIQTPINRNVWADPAMLQDLLRKIPVERMGQTEEIAACVAFLCSDEASYVTGAVLYVDGGMTLYPEFRHGG